MGAAAAGKLLEPDRLGLDLPRLAPVLEQFCSVEGAGTVEDVQKALRMLEGVGGGVEAALARRRRQQAIAAALADMQRLGHGAEIRLQTAGERCRDTERHRGS